MASTLEQSYLSCFPGFTPNPSGTTMTVFDDLKVARKWKQGSKRCRSEYRQYMMARYETHLGHLDHEEKLEALQRLCRGPGFTTAPNSITQCKKELQSRVFVNVIDVIDRLAHDVPFKPFKSQKELKSYTVEAGKFFPLGNAQPGSLLHVLLHHLA